MFRLKVIVALLAALWATRVSFGSTEEREALVKAVLSEDAAEQNALLQKLIGSTDSIVAQALTAWRGGGLYLIETDGAKFPIFLEAQTDSEGRAHGIKVNDGANVLDPL